MRRGSQEAIVITSPIVETEGRKSGGQIIGVSLGWDWVPEHEWGISGICGRFGVPGKSSRGCVGADVRTITKVPDELKFFDNLDGYAYLMFTDSFSYTKPEDFTAKNFNRMLRLYDEKEDFSTAWSERDFGVRMKNDDALNIGGSVLGQIYDAFTKRDGMIFLGGQKGPFGNRGLVLSIRSRMPADFLEKMKAADEDYLNLLDASEKTGIKQKLEAAGKNYYALSPRWSTGFKDDDTKTEHPVVYWLNPEDQRGNNAGWFTVEQLLEWIDGKGPIPKAEAA